MTGQSELITELAAQFRSVGIESPECDARILVEEVARGGAVTAEAGQKIRQLAGRRLRREPLQYILGKAWFMELELEVTPAVLIPRPETELLAEEAIKRLPHGGALLDLGTGSGAIALSVAQARPDCRVTGVDLSQDALSVARRNRDRYILKNVELILSDLDAAVTSRRFDFVAANLPYVTEEEYSALSPEVHDFEPVMALTAPEAGLALMRRAAARLPMLLNAGGVAMFELAPAQAAPVKAMFEAAGLSRVEIRRDLCGRDRFVAGQIEVSKASN
ncbi:MAG: peptide chain release factor N(5)-glutamine methyltransferase [Victivallaceae bacterium]|nr:peptide chain release factor N(5)-glutamine methyltransferase [Victivallaceae bacterium]